MNCTCNATDSWGKPLLTDWIWYTYFFTIMHSTQINRGLPITSLIRLGKVKISLHSYSLSQHKDAGGRNKDNQEPRTVCG